MFYMLHYLGWFVLYPRCRVNWDTNLFVVCVLCNFVIASTVHVGSSECGVPNLWGASPLSCSLLHTIWFRSLATQLPSDEHTHTPLFPSRLRPVCPSVAKDLQQDVEQRDGLEDGCLVDGRRATRSLLEKALFWRKLPMVRRRAEGSAARCWTTRRARRWTPGQRIWGHTSYCSEKHCLNEKGWWWWRTCWSKRRAAVRRKTSGKTFSASCRQCCEWFAVFLDEWRRWWARNVYNLWYHSGSN